MRFIAGAVLLGLGLAGCQTTGGATTTASLSFVAVAGKPTQLNYYLSLNPDCSAGSLPTIRIVQQPQNGTLKIMSGTNFPNFHQENIRSACNRKRSASQQVWYTGNSAGANDLVIVEAIFSNGRTILHSFNIANR